MYSDMNEGTVIHGRTETEIERTHFFLGAVATNHKRNENEVMPQLLKLRKKVSNGARFIVNQIGYNARKDHELLQWVRQEGLPISLLANVFVLSRASARVFNTGRVPGVTISPELLAEVERHAASPDKGRRLGAGPRGAPGRDRARAWASAARTSAGISRRRTTRPSSRRPTATRPDWATLAREVQFDLDGRVVPVRARRRRRGCRRPSSNREYVAVAAQAAPRPRRAAPLQGQPPRAPPRLRRRRPAAGPGRALYERAERAPRIVGKTLHMAEQAAKVPMFECRDCGDCSLPDIAYLCPESQCAKNQRNGPCGGTREDSLCEVGEKTCIWALAYDRLKAYGEESTMLEGPPVIKDNALRTPARGRTRSSAATTTPGASAEARRQGRARDRVRHGRAGLGQREDDLRPVRPPGATIAGVDRDLDAAAETQRIIRDEGGACEVDTCDVTDAEQVAAYVARVVERFGRIDVLVNNVGRSAPGGPVELDPQAWEDQMAVNLRSAYLLCHEVLPVMERAGGGAVVSVASVAGLRYIGKPQVGYAAAKAALLQFTRTTGVIYASRGVRLNCVVPGLIHTPLVDRLADLYADGDREGYAAHRHAQVPMGRMGDAWDVAHAALFLASDEARYITATELVVDGGLVATTP